MEQERLATRLAGHARLDHVFFCNSGAEANEAAVKMARRFKNRTSGEGCYKILCAGGSFHGRTLAMLAATDKPLFRDGFGPMPLGFEHVPFGNLNSLRDALSDDVAAIMVEPIMGEGGIKVIPDWCLRELRKICNKKKILLILDEVQCGIGRTGDFFAFENSKVKPDIVPIAKGIGGGFPIGAVLMKKNVALSMSPGSHGSTFGGNPLAMSVGNAVLDQILKKGFLNNLKKISKYFHQELNKIKKDYPNIIKEIRGKGLLIGIQLNFDQSKFIKSLEKNYLLTIRAAENVIRILPPLNVKKNEIDLALKIIDKVCKEYK